MSIHSDVFKEPTPNPVHDEAEDEGEDKDEESEQELSNKRYRRKSNSCCNLRPSYLSANSNVCLLLTEMIIGEKMSEDLKKLPRSAGYRWRRPTHVPICVRIEDRYCIKTINISRTLVLVTRAIFNTASDVGYIVNPRKISHFDMTIERLKAPVGSNTISGMFHPNLLNALLDSKDKEVRKWLVKWKSLIPKRLAYLKKKCNFVSGIR
jgi:hypothetical protein